MTAPKDGVPLLGDLRFSKRSIQMEKNQQIEILIPQLINAAYSLSEEVSEEQRLAILQRMPANSLEPKKATAVSDETAE